jgi:hypothetical protein
MKRAKPRKIPVHLLLDEPLAVALDDHRRREQELPNRQDAIRKILARVLLGKAKAA